MTDLEDLRADLLNVEPDDCGNDALCALALSTIEELEAELAKAEHRGAERMRERAKAAILALISTASAPNKSVPPMFKMGAEAGLDQASYAIRALPLTEEGE